MQPPHPSALPLLVPLVVLPPHSITGGCGFIASHVAIRLAKHYPDYKVMGRRRQNTSGSGQDGAGAGHANAGLHTTTVAPVLVLQERAHADLTPLPSGGVAVVR